MRLCEMLSTFFRSKYTRVTTIICVELVAILCLTVYQYFKYLPAPDINVVLSKIIADIRIILPGASSETFGTKD